LIENKYDNRYPKDRQVILGIVGKPIEVEFDSKLLTHALENVLSNAYKYSTQGNIRMELRFESSQVAIVIADNGIGIPANDIPNLFEPFFRSGNTDEIEGTGLGLAIVKDFIEIHKGQVFINSELGKGTTVSILLPLIQ